MTLRCSSVLLFLSLLLLAAAVQPPLAGADEIPTTLEGPFKPVTVNVTPRPPPEDLPATDPRVQRNVTAFEPEQISVTLSSTFDSVWISWITGEYQIGYDIKPLDPNTVKSVVVFGVLGQNMTRNSTGYSQIYNQLYPYPGLQNYTSGIIHHVRLMGLQPNMSYQYQCGDPSQGMSSIHSFRTMPVSKPASYPARIAIVGDLGLTYNTTSTMDHLASNNPDLMLLVGDVTYADRYLTNGSIMKTSIPQTYQPRWDYWSRFMQSVTSNIPIMVVEGNHELEPQVDNKTFVAYSSRFAFPSNESGSFSTFYYSFDAGGVHFIMLGAYTDYDKSSDQYAWLEKDLARVDRSVTPWLIVTWHPPWYSTYVSHYKEVECMRTSMEDLLYQYRVDLVINGHVHAYERSNRVYNYTLDPCGPVHIVVGDGGNIEGLAVKHADDPGSCPSPSSASPCASNFTSGPAAGQFCWDTQPEYSAFRESSFGHGILEVINDTYALWTWHRNQDVYNATGDIIYIVRTPDKCPIPNN